MFKFLFDDLGVPLGTSLSKRDSSDYLAGAAIINQSLNNAIQAGDSTAQRNQAEHFFDEGWRNQFKSLLMQMDYNSQLSQRRRLEAAGYSPYALFGNNGGSSISSSLGNGTQVPSSLPHLDNTAFSQAADILNSSKVAEAQSASLAQQTAGMAIDNFSRDARNQSNIRQMLASAGLDDASALGKSLDALVVQNSFGSLVAANQEHVRLIQSQIKQNAANTALLNMNTRKSSKELSWIDRMNQQELANMAAQVTYYNASAKQSLASARAQLANAFMLYAQKEGQDISNSIARETADFVINEKMWDDMIKSQRYNNITEFGSEQVVNSFEDTSKSPLQNWLGGRSTTERGAKRITRGSSHPRSWLNPKYLGSPNP